MLEKKNSFFNFLKSPETRRQKRATKEVDAEKITAEEAGSRLLHTPKPKEKLPSQGILFDHFVVVGADQSDDTTPKILYSFPEDIPPNYPGIEDFCFPESIKTHPVSLSQCNSELLELTHNRAYVQPDNQFVFLFTNNEGRMYYGICIHKKEIFEDLPLGLGEESSSDTDTQSSTIRCYCIVSRFPFFRLHFNFLLALFSVDQLSRLQQHQPTIEDDEELKVFLGVAKKKISRGKSLEPRAFGMNASADDIPFHRRSFSTVQPNRGQPRLKDKAHNAKKPLKQKKERKCKQRCTTEPSYAPLTAQYEPLQNILTEEKIQTLQDDIKNETDQENSTNACLESLNIFFNTELPKRGQRLTTTISKYLNPITFERPFFDEKAELYAEWGLPMTFYQLSFKTIIVLLSAIFLERQVIVYCKNLRFLSTLVLSIFPLLRPFVYQSIVIPMLPHNLPHLLEAPVPYVIGITNNSNFTVPDDVVVFDVQKDSYKSSTPIPIIPGYRALKKQCTKYLKDLNNTFKMENGSPPYNTTKKQLSIVENISTTFENHFGSWFAHFDNYTICNKTNPEQPITVFMKESFLADIEDNATLDFIEPFLETQTFFHYSDKCLRKKDKVRITNVDIS